MGLDFEFLLQNKKVQLHSDLERKKEFEENVGKNRLKSMLLKLQLDSR
jgi:hypothetical protein